MLSENSFTMPQRLPLSRALETPIRTSFTQRRNRSNDLEALTSHSAVSECIAHFPLQDREQLQERFQARQHFAIMACTRLINKAGHDWKREPFQASVIHSAHNRCSVATHMCPTVSNSIGQPCVAAVAVSNAVTSSAFFP